MDLLGTEGQRVPRTMADPHPCSLQPLTLHLEETKQSLLARALDHLLTLGTRAFPAAWPTSAPCRPHAVLMGLGAGSWQFP